ncbi:MAG: DUF3177 family protein [Leptolyngbya sp. SIO4C1]|nr:DUF3177 family protein [Leptolyngbya sp. SIO4C1]
MLDIDLLRSLIWTDYRLAVVFTVLLPLVLLVWAFVQRAEALQLLLVIYWKVSSLLAITLYLMIGGLSISFVTALMARVLIPISLWYWADINEEIREQPSGLLKLVFSAWRWAITVYCAVGALFQIPFLRCAFSRAALGDPTCQAWLEAPRLYKAYLHASYTPGFLAFWGIVGLVIYLLVLGYFVFFRIGRQGRSAINQ